jgi:MFS family permease
MAHNSISGNRSESVETAESLWGNGDFLKLWSAQTVSALGDQFTALAIPLIAVLMLKATPVQMGILTAVERVPFLLLSLFAGVWVDRLPRRPILIVGDFGRGLVLLSIPLAAAAHSVSMLQLYVVALLVGLLSVFFDVSYQAILPVLVDRKQLVEGNSKLEATRSLASLAGPSIAGFGIQFISAPAVIILDALSFFISGGVIKMIKRREPHRDKSSTSPMLAEIREGLSLVLGNPLLRSIAGCAATWNLFGTALLTLYFLFATRVLALGPTKIGVILSLGNVSGLLGVLGAGRLATRFGVGPVIVSAALIGGIGSIPIVLATPHTALPLLVFAGLLTSFVGPVYNINQVSLRQAITPHHLQGRMNATMKFLIVSTMPVGGLVGGVLGGKLGLRPAIAIIVTGGLLPFFWVLLSPVRHLRAIPESTD